MRLKRYVHLWSMLSLAMIVPYTLIGKPLSEDTILTVSMFAVSRSFKPCTDLLVYRIGGIGAAMEKTKAAAANCEGQKNYVKQKMQYNSVFVFTLIPREIHFSDHVCLSLNTANYSYFT